MLVLRAISQAGHEASVKLQDAVRRTRRQDTELPDDAPIDLSKGAVKRFIGSLDVEGLREPRRVAKRLERYTAH